MGYLYFSPFKVDKILLVARPGSSSQSQGPPPRLMTRRHTHGEWLTFPPPSRQGRTETSGGRHPNYRSSPQMSGQIDPAT